MCEKRMGFVLGTVILCIVFLGIVISIIVGMSAVSDAFEDITGF